MNYQKELDKLVLNYPMTGGCPSSFCIVAVRLAVVMYWNI